MSDTATNTATTGDKGSTATSSANIGPSPVLNSAAPASSSNVGANTQNRASADYNSETVASSAGGGNLSQENLDSLAISGGDGESTTSLGGSEMGGQLTGKTLGAPTLAVTFASSIVQGGAESTSAETLADRPIDDDGPGVDALIRLERVLVRSAIDGLLWQQSDGTATGAAIKGFDLLLDFMPFDRSSLEKVVDQFVEDFNSLSLDQLDSLQAFDMIPGLLTGAAILSAMIIAGKIRNENAGDESFEDESGESSSFSGFPGLPSLQSWES